MKWCNNLHCVGNKSEIFQLKKKDSLEIFSAYMQKVNFKNCIIFNLFYLRFSFGPHVCIGNPSFRICGVVPCHGNIRNIILLHTYPTSTLHWQLFSSHHSLLTHDTDTNWERPMFVEFCSSIPACVIISSMFFTMGNREFLHGISLLRQGKSN